MGEMPIPFGYEIYRENHALLTDKPFVVCSFFTGGGDIWQKCAERLASSCERYELPYSIYIVPSVHESISAKGSDDLSYTKPNFIYFNLEKFTDKDVFYMDVDTLFVQPPDELFSLREGECDLAIYNWLSDKHNEAYLRINPSNAQRDNDSALYAFSHDVSLYSTSQLISSGGVQYYGNTKRARFLLNRWLVTIADNPGCSDDRCLDYAFNHFIFNRLKLRAVWLDKAYLRMAWWPHVRPIILHPEYPGIKPGHVPHQPGPPDRYYPELCESRTWGSFFPKDVLIDVEKKVLLRRNDGQIIGKIAEDIDFWIYAANFRLA